MIAQAPPSPAHQEQTTAKRNVLDQQIAQDAHRTILLADVGNNFGSVARVSRGTTGQVANIDGEQQVQTAVLKYKGETLFGRKALQRSYLSPNTLHRDVKGRLLTAPHDPLDGDGTTPVEVLGIQISHLIQAARLHDPDLDQAYDRGEVDTYIAKPSAFGEAQKQLYYEACAQHGIAPAGFIDEPVAGTMFVRSKYSEHFRDGLFGCSVDLGSSTADFFFWQFKGGVFQEIRANEGIRLGGSDFTGLLYEELCKRVGVPELADLFTRGEGLCLSDDRLSPKQRRYAMKLWEEAEQAKRDICISGSYEGAIDLDTLVEVTLDRAKAMQLWSSLIDEIVAAFDTFLSGIADEQRPTVLCIFGGCAHIPDVKERLALVAGVEQDKTLFVADSATAIALGGAEFLASGCSGDAVLNRGIGVLVRDPVTNDEHVRVLASQGTTIPRDGLYLQSDGFQIQPVNGQAALALQCREIQLDAATADIQGQTVVPVSSTAPLGTCQFSFSGLGNDVERLSLQLHHRDGVPKFTVHLPDTDLESQQASVLDSGDVGRDVKEPTHVILLCDVSISMGKNGIAKVQEGIRSILGKLMDGQTAVSMVTFGSQAQVLLNRSTDETEVLQSVNSLADAGSTNLAEALEAAIGLVEPGERTIVFAYSDGHPNSAPLSIEQAKKLRDVVDRIVTFGIGSIADHDLLRDFIASRPEDHTEGTTDDIPAVFSALVDLYLRPSPTAVGV